jgi:hypothetical protein
MKGKKMKAISTFLLGFGAVGALLYIALCFGIIGATFYGLYLAFSASIILGIIALVVQPSPLIIGLVMIFFHKNLAQIVLHLLNQ